MIFGNHTIEKEKITMDFLDQNCKILRENYYWGCGKYLILRKDE
jgi:hypothetical protein